ncbi:unnamed protein product [Pleuronectes platessa]|uniref:Uncharacterized protein n=1 Tax=Pleuronectes platessa TaxID=8262 RepID=A0A9N7VG08_PLEPL|nr:unnamed protein product [Pleuronectes platessa]
MESMQAASAESRELEKDDIADYQQAADDQQAEASNFPPVEIKADEENPWPHLSKQFAFKRKRGNSYIMLKLNKKFSRSETLEEISVVEAWLKERPWVSHFVLHLVVVQDRLKRLSNPPAPATDLDAESRLALDGSRSLQNAENLHLYSLLRGTSHQPHPLTGTWGAVGLVGDPAASKRLLVWVVDVGEAALQQSAQRHQPPPVPTGLQSPVPAPRRRSPADVSSSDGRGPHSGVGSSPCSAPEWSSQRRRLQSLFHAGWVPADATLVLVSEVLAVPAPVPAPRLRFLADVSHPPMSEVLTAACIPVHAPRRRFPADVPLLQASEVLTSSASVPVPRRRPPADVSPVRADVPPFQESEVPAESAAVPVPHRRVQAEVPPVQALEVFAAPIMGPVPPADPAPRPGLRSAPFCAALERPRCRPPEPQRSVPERPQSRPPELRGMSQSPSSGSPLLPPVAVHVLGRLASGP